MSEEEIQRWVEYSRRVLNPTPEERAEIERKHQESLEKFKRNTAARKKRIREQILAQQQQQQQQQPKRFFGIKIGGWY